jgi:hypothetical protein
MTSKQDTPVHCISLDEMQRIAPSEFDTTRLISHIPRDEPCKGMCAQNENCHFIYSGKKKVVIHHTIDIFSTLEERDLFVKNFQEGPITDIQMENLTWMTFPSGYENIMGLKGSFKPWPNQMPLIILSVMFTKDLHMHHIIIADEKLRISLFFEMADIINK